MTEARRRSDLQTQQLHERLDCDAVVVGFMIDGLCTNTLFRFVNCTKSLPESVDRATSEAFVAKVVPILGWSWGSQ